MTQFASRVPVQQKLEQKGKVDKDVVAVRVNGAIADLHTPVAETDTVEPIRKSDPEALEVIRHSTAHVMADAVQRLFPGTKVTIGPAIDNGFYYDFDRPEGAFSDEDLEKIEKTMRSIIGQDLPFHREVMSREEAHALFEKMGETYKLELIDSAKGEISVYRHGDWVDFCQGPHVPSTRFLQAVKLTHVAGAYWRGDERNPMLQRIYGTAFSTQKELDAYLTQLEEAKKRDHRKLAKELDLVAFHHLAPASPFFLPRGAAVYNRLIDYVRALYAKYGYQEVITPQIFDLELFRTSGHATSYAENMFVAGACEDPKEAQALREGKEFHISPRFGVKPMNCPGHALLFGTTRRSYRELPFRMADFGRLHRYERSGVTQGMTRVRTFCQDDAHIFCTLDQMHAEIAKFNQLVFDVYRDFGFSDVSVVIATRPADRLGSDAVWDQSEGALTSAMNDAGMKWSLAEGEGAFYGPKIEYHLKDAIGRSWQLGTMQVDFNMPELFDLAYIGEDNKEHRPVMLHRAILGSVERFFGLLIEHVAGAFPSWLAPEQLCIVTVSEKFDQFAKNAEKELKKQGLRVVLDLSSDKLGAKIRRAHGMRYPMVAVVGQKEVDGNGLSLRIREGNQELGFVAMPEVVAKLNAENVPPSLRPEGG